MTRRGGYYSHPAHQNLAMRLMYNRSRNDHRIKRGSRRRAHSIPGLIPTSPPGTTCLETQEGRTRHLNRSLIIAALGRALAERHRPLPSAIGPRTTSFEIETLPRGHLERV